MHLRRCIDRPGRAFNSALCSHHCYSAACRGGIFGLGFSVSFRLSEPGLLSPVDGSPKDVSGALSFLATTHTIPRGLGSHFVPVSLVIMTEPNVPAPDLGALLRSYEGTLIARVQLSEFQSWGDTMLHGFRSQIASHEQLERTCLDELIKRRRALASNV